MPSARTATRKSTSRKSKTKTENSSPKVIRAAARKCGYRELRPGQEEALAALVSGKDVLAILPTGAGKSAIYHIAQSLLAGPCVVVSPLLALQKDQLEAIENSAIGRAALLNSALSPSEHAEVLSRWQAADLDFLLLAPEQFARDDVAAAISRKPPALFVVDEAHCVVAWGHEFRPDYLKLGAVVEQLHHPRVLALTATASPPVRNEIVERLQMQHAEIVARGFDRPNISLDVRRFDAADEKRESLLAEIESTLDIKEQPGIIYCATRAAAEEIGQALQERGIAAHIYHAGMSKADREAAQNDFMAGSVQCMVATNAFGMGVDKPDVRWVFHHDVPDSLDSYYQELGRAGRDGAAARAILFYAPQDLGVRRFFASGGQIGAEDVEEVFSLVEDKVEESDEPLPIEEVAATVAEETELSKNKAKRVIEALADTGAIELTSGEIATSEGSKQQVAAQIAEQDENRKAFEKSRLEMMRSYSELGACRRAFLLNYFGEEYSATSCGNCDNCLRHNERVAGEETMADAENQPYPIQSRVRHSEWGEGAVLRYEEDKIWVLFDTVGYKTLALALVVENDLLQPLS